jgi:hypothetical protein
LTFADGRRIAAVLTVETEAMHPDPPGRVHLGICAMAFVVGIALTVLAGSLPGLWGPIRIILGLAGAALVILAPLQALNVTTLRVGVSRDGGFTASAERPIGYTKTVTKGDSPIEGAISAEVALERLIPRWASQDSNLGPTNYEFAALTN